MTRKLVAVFAALLAAQPLPAQLAEPAAEPRIDLKAALAGRTVQVVLVKDFMRIQNDAKTLPRVEFERYVPVCDPEQFVLARWVEAQTDGGTALPIEVVSVREDEAGNLIQRLRISPLPGKVGTRIALSSLVARRERPYPGGDHPILAAALYPAPVRQFLEPSPTATCDDPVVARTAREVLVKTQDTLGVAREIAALARARSYLPDKQKPADSLAGHVLLNGGSCCASAVAAASVFRACGIPAQITYCPPASYVHGIVRFWVPEHGWVRMDATSGTGKLPLTQEGPDLALVRVFDMPWEMEKIDIAWAWPYHNTDGDGRYRFWSGGAVAAGVRFAARDEAAAAARGGVSGFVDDPFSHLEPGSWSKVLASQPIEGPWADWDALVAAARAAVKAARLGPYEEITGNLADYPAWRDAARPYDYHPEPN